MFSRVDYIIVVDNGVDFFLSNMPIMQKGGVLSKGKGIYFPLCLTVCLEFGLQHTSCNLGP